MKCNYCKKETGRKPQKSNGNSIRVYCNKNCYRTDLKRRSRFETKCGFCKKPLSVLKKRKRKENFCSKSCRAKIVSVWQKGRRHKNYKHGKSYYRQKALNHFPHECNRKNCPIDFEFPDAMLDAHHKDGNRNNNDLRNLELLCVWCHALETRKDRI